VLLTKSIEGVVAEQFPLGPAGGRGATAVAHQEDEFTVGYPAPESLDEGGANEAGRAGDGDLLPREAFGDHTAMSSRFSTKW
jgi:hypothetical protein